MMMMMIVLPSCWYRRVVAGSKRVVPVDAAQHKEGDNHDRDAMGGDESNIEQMLVGFWMVSVVLFFVLVLNSCVKGEE